MIIGREFTRYWLQLAKWYILPNRLSAQPCFPIVARKAHHPQHARKDLWLLLIVSGILGSGIVGLICLDVRYSGTFGIY